MRKAMACLVALVATAVSANAAPIFTVTNNSSGTFLGNPPFTLGFQFSVGSTPKLLASLGIFDSDRNGLAVPHAVGICNSAGTLLASGVIPAGTAARLENQFRYIDITPITLQAGSGAHMAFMQSSWDGPHKKSNLSEINSYFWDRSHEKYN
ncbi:MAG: hypothetical protein ABGY75_04940, partial [Gemmataceae bacterium]